MTEYTNQALEKLFDDKTSVNPFCAAIREPINVTLVRVVPDLWRPGSAGYYLEVGKRRTLEDPEGKILDHDEALDVIRGLVNFYSETTPEQIRTENRHQWDPSVTVRVIREMEKRNDPEATAGSVYLIRAPGGEVKIGMTTNLKSRLKSLSGGTPGEHELLYTIETTTPAEVERSLHDHYHAKRIGRSEWFELDAEDIEEIKAMRFDCEGHVMEDSPWWDRELVFGFDPRQYTDTLGVVLMK